MLGEIDSHEFHLVARRKSGIGAAAAVAGVEVLGAQVHDAFPDSRMGRRGALSAPGGGGRRDARAWGASAHPLNDARVAPSIRRAVLVLFGAVAFVLLIACANVANLLLARADLRRRELAVRRAIGAGRARLVRLLLTESVLLAAFGGGAGLLLARSTVRALSKIDPAITLRAGGSGGMGAVSFASIQLDWTALGFAFAVTLLVGLLFGLLPALDLTSTTLNATMKDAHARVTAGRRCLVIAEVALTMVLLAGSGLMIRTLGKLLSVDPGFDGRNVLTVRLTVPPGGLARDSLPVFYVQLLDRLRAVPGVLEVAIGNCPPLNGGCNGTGVTLLDRPKNAAEVLSTGVHWVTPGWFGTLGVPLKRGRDFTRADRMGAPKVVVINETAARQFWAGEDPIGRRVGVGQGGFSDGAEVVGIVGDVRQNMDSLPTADVYLPYFQSPRPGMMIFVRTAEIPGRSATAVRAALREVAPHYPIYDLKPMRERAAAATAQARFGAVLLGVFAATALALAVIGVYGVVSLMVSARTREIGVRVALGADQRRVQRLVIGAGLLLALVGTALGLAGALLATRTLRSLLFELSPTDPATYAATAALLVGAATLASWVPARRAARLDPMRALRAD
jgi:putative ABC transport system permease protein